MCKEHPVGTELGTEIWDQNLLKTVVKTPMTNTTTAQVHLPSRHRHCQKLSLHFLQERRGPSFHHHSFHHLRHPIQSVGETTELRNSTYVSLNACRVISFHPGQPAREKQHST